MLSGQITNGDKKREKKDDLGHQKRKKKEGE